MTQCSFHLFQDKVDHPGLDHVVGQADALGDPGVALGRGRQDVGPRVEEPPVVPVLRWTKSHYAGT